MGRTASVTVLVIVFLLVSLSVATLIAGVTGDSWWIGQSERNEKGVSYGLWRTCRIKRDPYSMYERNTVCEDRADALKFPSSPGTLSDKNKDITLLLLLISACLAVVCWITTLCMCCCLSKRTLWKCNSAITGCLSILTAGTGFAGVIFAEIEFDSLWNRYDYGWSAICAWIGSAAALISAVVLFLLACMNPKSKTSRPVMVGRANQGYNQEHQMNYQMQQAHVPNYR